MGIYRWILPLIAVVASAIAVMLVLSAEAEGAVRSPGLLPHEGGGYLETGSCTWRNIGEVRGTWPYDYQCKSSGRWVSWRIGDVGD